MLVSRSSEGVFADVRMLFLLHPKKTHLTLAFDKSKVGGGGFVGADGDFQSFIRHARESLCRSVPDEAEWVGEG